MADAGETWMPWRRVDYGPWLFAVTRPTPAHKHPWPLDGRQWWIELAVNGAIMGYAVVWREATGRYVGWVNPETGATQRTTHATEHKAMCWCQKRLREAVAIP